MQMEVLCQNATVSESASRAHVGAVIVLMSISRILWMVALRIREMGSIHGNEKARPSRR